MSLHRPRAGEPEVIFDAGRGRCMVKRSFFYGDREAVYKIWWYLKEPPALIFAITPNREVVAIRQFRHGANDFMLELPGGIPDQKSEEVHRDVAERELLEETGYKVERVIDLNCSPYIDAPSFNLRIVPFMGLGARKVQEPKLDPNEEGMETVLVPLEEWYKKIWNGEILDSKTISHSLLALPFVSNIEFR